MNITTREFIRTWANRLTIASVWGFAWGVTIEVMQGLTPAGTVWVLTIFATAAGIAWILTRPRKN